MACARRLPLRSRADSLPLWTPPPTAIARGPSQADLAEVRELAPELAPRICTANAGGAGRLLARLEALPELEAV
eukprot:3197656-Alexandrium_andersonii.AAC.1